MHGSLASTRYIDCEHPEVVGFAARVADAATDPVERARRLYAAVRDEVRYDPYSISFDPDTYVASNVLASGGAYCVPKAVLLCAAARASGIPAMLGFADVRNHLNTEKLRGIMGGDEFIYHGYAALHLGGRWVKATPTFNIELCRKFAVEPLEFDGERDALLQAYDGDGRRHMEYVRDHGRFDELPFERIRDAFRAAYPGLEQSLQAMHDARFEDERPLTR